MASMGLASRHALSLGGAAVAPSARLRCQSLRLLVTVTSAAAAPAQLAGLQQTIAASTAQPVATRQQQQRVTLHRNKRQKHQPQMPPQPPKDPPVHPSLAQFASCRALVLDSSYRPIDIINWQRAICLDLFDKVDVLEYFEDISVRSARSNHLIPAVCRVRFYVKRNWKGARLSLSRRNIMLRDRFCCQYCGSRSNLTLDHVKPASKGGKFTWENMVTACMTCNGKKGDSSLKQLGWTLRKQPKEPSASEVAIIAGMGISDMRSPPKEWEPFLFPNQMPVFANDDTSLWHA